MMKLDHSQLGLAHAIADGLGEGICAVDGAGSTIFLNRVAEDQLGRLEADLRDHDLHAAIHPSGADGAPCRPDRCPLLGPIRNGGRAGGEDVLTRRDGTTFPVSFTTAALVPGEPTAGAVLAFTDLTSKLRTEERLRLLRAHGERVGALEKAKSQFMNVASHELRSPLGVLSGYLSMLEDGTLGPLAPRQARVLPILRAKIHEMDGLVGQMLDSARLEDHRLELDLRPRDLRELAQEAVDRIRPTVSERHRVVVRMPEHAVTAGVDAWRVTTIIQNLVDNALKYSPEGGQVTVVLEPVEPHAQITVADEGIGIAEDALPRLFTRFGRLVGSEHDHISGTGLGLYLARELARMHGGDIHYRPGESRGSVFTLRLPAVPAAAGQPRL